MHTQPFFRVSVDRLIQGKARIEAGWCQRRNWDEQGNVCMRGAIYTENRVWDIAAELAEEYLLKSQAWDGIAFFNDAPGRTKEDILDAYDRAIALAEADLGNVEAKELVDV